MRPFIISCLLLLTAVVSLSTSKVSHLKIVSPRPGSNLQLGFHVNITVGVPLGSIQSYKDILLGFSLNANDRASGTLIGLLNTTQAPFSQKTGRLSYSFVIPSDDKLHLGSNYSLVVFNQTSSGHSHTAHSNLASIPIILVDVANPTSGTNMMANHRAVRLYTEAASIPKTDVNASIIAKGHNTGDTIPRIIPTDEASGVKANTSVAPAAKSPSTDHSGTDLTIQKNSSPANSETTSGAPRKGISAVLFAIAALSFFCVSY